MKLVADDVNRSLHQPLPVLYQSHVAGALESPQQPQVSPFRNSHVLTSVANNGSAFAGLNANTASTNIGLAIAMWLGRSCDRCPYACASRHTRPERHVLSGKGTLDTASHLFAGLLIGVVLLVGALALPVLALGTRS